METSRFHFVSPETDEESTCISGVAHNVLVKLHLSYCHPKTCNWGQPPRAHETVWTSYNHYPNLYHSYQLLHPSEWQVVSVHLIPQQVSQRLSMARYTAGTGIRPQRDLNPILTSTSPLRGDKVSMLTHIYPHKPWRNIEVTICKITRLTAHFMCGLMSDLLICTCL